MAYNSLSHVNGTTNIYVTSTGGNTPDTQNLILGNTIGYAKIKPMVVFQETTTPFLYSYTNHLMNGGVGQSGGNVSIPQYLDGWTYESGGTQVDFTSEGYEFDNTVLSLFDETTHNLDLYAKWGNTHVIRVIVFESVTNFLVSKPFGEVAISSDDSYEGVGDSARNLPYEFEEIFDRNGNFPFNYNGNLEYGVGSGCPATIPGTSTKVNTYYGVKDGADFDLELSSILAKNYSTNTTHDWYELTSDKDTGDKIVFYQQSLTTIWPGGTPSTSGWYTKVVTLDQQNDTYNCTFTNITTDITIYVPYTIKETVRIDASTNPINEGSVTITPTEMVGAGPGNNITAFTMPGDSVTLTATVPNGYSFDGWYLNSGVSPISSSTTYTFTAPAVSSGTQSYVAKFVANTYSIIYHKTMV